MAFFTSGIGQYFSQTILHSFVTALVVEAIMKSDLIREPSLQIKMRSLSLWLPVIYLPVLFIAYPSRTSEQFHQAALFDSNQWLGLQLTGPVYLWHMFAALLAFTAAFFAVKELYPAIRYAAGNSPSQPALQRGQFIQLDSLLDNLRLKKEISGVTVLMSGDTAPIVYTAGRKKLVLSKAAIELLDSEELEAVIAHELAHFSLWVLLLGRINLTLRFLMFYNPVALLVFHRINNDTEKLCDDLAILRTGFRLALVSGLLKIFKGTAGNTDPGEKKLALSTSRLESRAHLALVKERAQRMMRNKDISSFSRGNWLVAVTASLLMVLLFFVV